MNRKRESRNSFDKLDNSQQFTPNESSDELNLSCDSESEFIITTRAAVKVKS